MTAKIVEVMALILEDLSKNFSLEEVHKNLIEDKKYDNKTIATAFSWVYDKLMSESKRGKNSVLPKERNFRILSNEEIEILGFDNYNYVIRLINVGLLRFSDLDLILEQLNMFPNERVSKEIINWLILFSLVEDNFNISPGSRILLTHSDTIN
jgi:uncharacterized protein Smg (DUF494 family)